MELQPIRALLIEDNAGDARLIQAYLEEVCGDTVDCFLERVERLAEGIERLAAGGIDVVLLDLSLPESSGLETFHAAHACAPGTPVIVLTGLNDQDLALRAVQEGAEDYLVKGQVQGDLLLRSMRYAIERSRRRGLEEKLRAAEAELRVAQQIQRGLHPEAAPSVRGLEISGASFPAEAVGGDYYDYFTLNGGSLGVVVADAVGHGVGPALLAAEARACLRTLALTHDRMSTMLELTNRVMVEGLQDDRFVTLLLARIDPRTNTLAYASAGHPSGYILDPDGEVRVTLESTGYPLGLFADAEFPAGAEHVLRAGETVLLVTDGLIEAHSAGSDELFGTERLLEVVKRHRHEPPPRVIEALYEAVLAFIDPADPGDDITALVIKVHDGPVDTTAEPGTGGAAEAEAPPGDDATPPA